MFSYFLFLFIITKVIAQENTESFENLPRANRKLDESFNEYIPVESNHNQRIFGHNISYSNPVRHRFSTNLANDVYNQVLKVRKSQRNYDNQLSNDINDQNDKYLNKTGDNSTKKDKGIEVFVSQTIEYNFTSIGNDTNYLTGFGLRTSDKNILPLFKNNLTSLEKNKDAYLTDLIKPGSNTLVQKILKKQVSQNNWGNQNNFNSTQNFQSNNLDTRTQRNNQDFVRNDINVRTNNFDMINGGRFIINNNNQNGSVPQFDRNAPGFSLNQNIPNQNVGNNNFQQNLIRNNNQNFQRQNFNSQNFNTQNNFQNNFSTQNFNNSSQNFNQINTNRDSRTLNNFSQNIPDSIPQNSHQVRNRNTSNLANILRDSIAQNSNQIRTNFGRNTPIPSNEYGANVPFRNNVQETTPSTIQNTFQNNGNSYGVPDNNNIPNNIQNQYGAPNQLQNTVNQNDYGPPQNSFNSQTQNTNVGTPQSVSNQYGLPSNQNTANQNIPNQNQYGPPQNSPTNQGQTNINRGKPQNVENQYGPPSNQNTFNQNIPNGIQNQYGPPQNVPNNQGQSNINSGTPQNVQNQYGPPNQNTGNRNIPNQNDIQNQYGPPQNSPNNQGTSNINVGTPQDNIQNQYGPPSNQNAGNRNIPNQNVIKNQYGPPQNIPNSQGQSNINRGTPQNVQNQYGPPSNQNVVNRNKPVQNGIQNQYGPPQNAPNNQGTSNINVGTPQNNIQNQYGPPNQNTGNRNIPNQNDIQNQYGPPQNIPNIQGQTNINTPQNQYGSPSSQNTANQNIPNQNVIQNQYGPPQNAQSNQGTSTIGTPQNNIQNQYGPPKNSDQSQSNKNTPQNNYQYDPPTNIPNENQENQIRLPERSTEQTTTSSFTGYQAEIPQNTYRSTQNIPTSTEPNQNRGQYSYPKPQTDFNNENRPNNEGYRSQNALNQFQNNENQGYRPQNIASDQENQDTQTQNDYQPSSGYADDIPSIPFELPGKTRVQKHIYFHVAPPFEEKRKKTQIKPDISPPEKHYKILFIKTPTVAPITSVVSPPQNEEKTLVYVLVKKPEIEDQIDIVTPKPTPPSKPEVFFIRYKNKKDENNTQSSTETYDYPKQMNEPVAKQVQIDPRYEQTPDYNTYLTLNNYQRSFEGQDDNVNTEGQISYIPNDSETFGANTANYLLGQYGNYILV